MNVIVRINTDVQVTLPGCAECNGPHPCPDCREKAIAAVADLIRGSFECRIGKDERVPVFSDFSLSDVVKVHVE